MTSSLALFYLASAIVVGGALGVVMARGFASAASSLLVSLLGVAALFLLAAAQLLALVQVLVYGGAATGLILIARNLAGAEEVRRHSDGARWPPAAVVALAAFGFLAASVLLTGARAGEGQRVDLDVLVSAAFTDWAPPLVVAVAALAVALIGTVAVLRARGGRE